MILKSKNNQNRNRNHMMGSVLVADFGCSDFETLIFLLISLNTAHLNELSPSSVIVENRMMLDQINSFAVDDMFSLSQ